jgi:hypothetical protein
MDVIYSALFACGLMSVFLMEIYTCCLNKTTGSNNRTSPLSMSIILAFSVQMILGSILPKIIQGRNLYVAKMFIAVLVFFPSSKVLSILKIIF